MVSNNEILHTVSDLDTGTHRHNLSNLIQDLQQQRTQHPQETQQYLAACNTTMEQKGVLPGLQLEGLNAKGDRIVLKNTSGVEFSLGFDGTSRQLQPGEKATTPDTTPMPVDTRIQRTDTTPKPHTTGDTGTTGTGAAGKGGDTDYTVKQGDSLWRIARKKLGHDASEKDVYALVKSIAKENSMKTINDTIHPDQTLKIPGDGSQQTSPQARQGDGTTPTPQPRPVDATPHPQTKPSTVESTQPTPGDGSQQPPSGDQPPAPGTTPTAGEKPSPLGAPAPRPGDQPHVPGTGDAITDRTPDAETQMGAIARKQAIKVLNEHMNDIFNLAAALPIDGKFPVGELTAMLDGPLGKTLDPRTLAMLQNVRSIEKHGNHIEITQNAPTRVPLNINEPGAVIDDVRVGQKISFDLGRDASGHNQLANVQGISVEGHTTAYKNVFSPMNHTFDAPLQNVTINRDASGNTVFDAHFKNPENWFEKLGEKVKGTNRGDHMDASIQLNDNGVVTISDPNSNVKHRIA